MLIGNRQFFCRQISVIHTYYEWPQQPSSNQKHHKHCDQFHSATANNLQQPNSHGIQFSLVTSGCYGVTEVSQSCLCDWGLRNAHLHLKLYMCVCHLSLASVLTRAYSRRRDDGIHLFFSALAKLRPPKPNMAEKPKHTNWPWDEKLHMSTCCRWPAGRETPAHWEKTL